jgi:hypothetical protein
MMTEIHPGFNRDLPIQATIPFLRRISDNRTALQVSALWITAEAFTIGSGKGSNEGVTPVVHD